MTRKWIEKKVASLVRMIEHYNKKLVDMYNLFETQDMYLDRSSTCGGLPEYISQYFITYHAKDRLVVERTVGKSKEVYDIHPEKDEEGNTYMAGAADFAEDMLWNKHRIKSAARFWNADDPDKFLESHDDEDE